MRSRAWTGKGPVRHSSDGFGRSALTLDRTTRQVIILVQSGPIAETRGQAPRAVRRRASRAARSTPPAGSDRCRPTRHLLTQPRAAELLDETGKPTGPR